MCHRNEASTGQMCERKAALKEGPWHVLGGCSDVDIHVSLEHKLSRIPGEVELVPLPVHVLCGVIRVLEGESQI